MMALIKSGLSEKAAEDAVAAQYHLLESWQELVVGVAVTTVCWITATFLSRPSDSKTMEKFVTLINPGGPGWKPVYRSLAKQNTTLPKKKKGESIPRGILAVVFGCALVYSALFASGYFLFGNLIPGFILAAVCIGSIAALLVLFRKQDA